MKDRTEFCLQGRPKLAEPYHLKGIGLPNIYLLNGVTFESDPHYGELVTIENLKGLHAANGLHIIEKSTPMTGTEFRFLRKQMRLTQVALAKLMLVTDQTIANYEKENTKSLGSADPLMRLVYLLHILPRESKVDLLKVLVDEIERQSSKTRVPDPPRRKIVEGWHEAPLVAA